MTMAAVYPALMLFVGFLAVFVGLLILAVFADALLMFQFCWNCRHCGTEIWWRRGYCWKRNCCVFPWRRGCVNWDKKAKESK